MPEFISQSELARLLGEHTALKLHLGKMAVRTREGRSGVVGINVGVMRRDMQPPKYDLGHAVTTKLLGRFIGGGIVTPNVHLGLLIASRVASGKIPGQYKLPVPAQLKTHATLARRHPDLIGGNLISPNAESAVLTLFRVRNPSDFRPDLLTALPDDAAPGLTAARMRQAGLAIAELNYGMPGMTPPASFHSLDKLYS